ncbi:MAG: hypothetical protein ACJAU6_000846 [Alphaproteobacteria bacterium]|jgi:hypothetical protein
MALFVASALSEVLFDGAIKPGSERLLYRFAKRANIVVWFSGSRVLNAEDAVSI